MSSFGVPKKLFEDIKTIRFPSYMYVSRNYYRSEWSMKTHRRLKNVIIALEWIPDINAVQPMEMVETKLSQQQIDMLQVAFNMFDTSGEGKLDIDEFCDVLNAVDVCIPKTATKREENTGAADSLPAETNVVRELFELVDHRKRGYIDFQDLQRMMETQLYNQNTAGKYFVVLSLSEAETLRSILHSVHDKTINEGQSSFALRFGSTIIDKSKTHAFAGKYQTDTVLCACIFR